MSVEPCDAVELARRFLRVPGTSGHEGDIADVVETVLRGFGFHDVGRTEHGSVYGVAGPSGRPAVLFDGHLDVVPVTGDWTVDPFGADIVGDRLYGRGATDMKGGLAAAVVGVAAAAAKGGLTKPVAVCATVLEETVEGVALGAVLDRLDPATVVICEPSDLEIKLGQRGRAEVLLSAVGVPAHAAYPERGINPLPALARALIALGELEPPHDDVLGDGILVPTDVITNPYPSVSLIPSSATARFDRRTITGETAESVLAGLREALVGVGDGFEVRLTAESIRSYTGLELAPERFLPAWTLNADHPFAVAAGVAVAGAGLPVRTGIYDFCTNGSESAGRRAIPTVGFGPGRPQDAHITDEYVSVQQVQHAAEVYRKIASEMGRW